MSDVVTTVELDGWIGSTGFATGHRVVVGHWTDSPVGPITDVMWGRPDGTRVLLAPNERAARFITAVYSFDDVEVGPVEGLVATDGALHVRTRSMLLRLRPRRLAVPLPGDLPPWVWTRIGAPIARALLGVEVHGTSPTGVEEWYRARSWAPLRSARGTLDGRDLGAMRPLDPPLGVGFSEPPRRPSLVRVAPLLRDRTGRVAAALGHP